MSKYIENEGSLVSIEAGSYNSGKEKDWTVACDVRLELGFPE